MSQQHYLIVEQQPQPPEDFPALLQELAQKHQLDLYQSRQRLVGRGLSLLAKGSAERLADISVILLRAQYVHWVVLPSKPGFVPHRIKNLKLSNEKIVFGCQKKEVVFPKKSNILAVFADLSGSLAEKSVQQLLSSHAYRGRDDIRHLEKDKILKIILQGKPVLDLYLLDPKNQIVDAVRIFPGKFDPKGLAERATVSSRQNLNQILNLAREYADVFHLDHDFGLVNLPGCILRRDDPDNPETQRHNLISLARYGWLMSDLLQAKSTNPTSNRQQESKVELTGAVAAAVFAQNPALAADHDAGDVIPVANEDAQELETSADTDIVRPKFGQSEAGLPAPPPPTQSAFSRWSTPGFWIGTGGSIAVMLLFILSDLGDSRWLNKATYHAFASGALPLLVAGIMFWSAFHFLRLKRQIENTPTSRVRSIAMGMVEVKGRALRRFALVSPISHTPCVFYRLTKYRRERNNQWKVTSVTSSHNVPFALEDDTGRVEIDPAGCRVSAGTKQEGTQGQVGLMRYNDDSDDKWVEEVIVDGTLLYVLGYAQTKPHSGPTLHEQKTEALREMKRNPQRMKEFDQNGDGVIDSDEWDTARIAVEEQVVRDSLASRSKRKKQEEHIVIGKKKGRPLIITETHSEDHLTARYLYYSLPLFLMAVIATGGAIYLFLNYLKTL